RAMGKVIFRYGHLSSTVGRSNAVNLAPCGAWTGFGSAWQCRRCCLPSSRRTVPGAAPCAAEGCPAREEEPMPDPVLIVQSSAVAAVLAAFVLLLTGWPWRRPRAGCVAAGGVLGLGAGLLVGAWWLGLAPQVPPREDRDRLLLVLLPAVLG